MDHKEIVLEKSNENDNNNNSIHKYYRCAYGIDKNRIDIDVYNKQKNILECKMYYSSSYDIVSSVYILCREKIDPLHNITLDITTILNDDKATDNHYILPSGVHKPFGFTLDCPSKEYMQHNDDNKTDDHVYHIIIRMQPKENDMKSILYTYINIYQQDEKSDQYQSVIVRQKREIRSIAYDLIDIFNNDDNGNEDDNKCLICLSVAPDCIIMPCRHMVINIECAQMMDEAKDKFMCPLCRCKVDEIIHVNTPIDTHNNNNESKQ